jgi:aminoglycoside phosphotransferase (APT) family kinase protein
MTTPWNEDISYNPEVVKSLISEHTDIVVNSVILLGSGWDNVVYLINDKFAIRLVKKEAGLEGSLAENAVLKKLPEMPFAFPAIIKQGHYKEKWPWIIYPVIEGSPIYETNYDEQVLQYSTKKVAQFLKILHAENVQDYKGLRGDFNNHMNIKKAY